MSREQPGNSLYALEATGLSAVLGGHKVLEIPSLCVNSNEVLTVIGPNGSGKSTLLLCLALLLRPATGTISYKGIPILSSKQALQLRRRLAVVFQDPLLLSSSVWDNVTLGLRLRGVRGDEASARARKWLERFGVASLAKRQARTLSGGEGKRVSLARAFVLQPEVLFLDEPFNALDSPTRQALLEDFDSVLRETKTSTVMVTHDRTEALALANRVAVLMNGRIRQIGSPEEVFNAPADEDVASFIGAGNVWHGVVESQSGGLASVNLDGHLLEAVSILAAGMPLTIFLRHEDITLSLPSPQATQTSARNKLAGRITKAMALGSQMRVTLDCGFPLVALITRRSWDDLGLGTGSGVIASFKASSVHLISGSARPRGQIDSPPG